MTASPSSSWDNIHARDTSVVRADLHEAPPSGRTVLRALARRPGFRFGLLIVGLAACVALAAPWLYPGNPQHGVATPLLWPGQDLAHPLGTDAIGCDVAAQLVHGTRVSMAIGMIAATLCACIGITLGAIAGYAGGLADAVFDKLVVLFQSSPQFLVLVVIFTFTPPSLWHVSLAIGILHWPMVARLTHAQFRSLRHADYVAAAQTLGYSTLHIIFREILPNAIGPVVSTLSVVVASAMLMEAGLSFLGLSNPNTVSWGSMIGAGRDMIQSHWYLTALPGLCLSLLILGFNALGDAMNAVLMPGQR